MNKYSVEIGAPGVHLTFLVEADSIGEAEDKGIAAALEEGTELFSIFFGDDAAEVAQGALNVGISERVEVFEIGKDGSQTSVFVR